MKTIWKEVTATISMLLIVLLAVALSNGLNEGVEGRWALASFVIFVLVGFTGLLTGTEMLMKRMWSRVTLYVLSGAIAVTTLVNAFLDSEAWFVAATLLTFLLWAEYFGVTYAMSRHHPSGPASTTPRGVS